MIAGIIQARVGSTRLPNKIFAEISGQPLIWHVVSRVRSSSKIDNIVLATTVNGIDDPVEEWAQRNKVDCYRGEEQDVLARFHGAASAVVASIVVRITADDPFKDPILIDKVVQTLLDTKSDFAFNTQPASFPEGLDTEVFTMTALEKAEFEANDDFEREHVTPYFYRHPELFKMVNVQNKEDLSYLRWTIDEKQDLEMARAVYRELYSEGKIFHMDDILALLQRKPEIARMNNNVRRSHMYVGKR